MSSKQRRRNQRKARRQADAARSGNRPSGDILKDHQDPQGQSTNGDRSKHAPNNGATKDVVVLAQEAVGYHRASHVEQSSPVATPNSSSVFSLSNRLSPDPDSVSLGEAAPRIGRDGPRRHRRGIFSAATWTLIVTLLLGAPTAFLAIKEILKYKALRVQYYAKAPLLTPEFGRAKEFQLTHRGRTVSDPYQLMITIRNSGTVAIKPADVAEPVVFRFSKKVLDASIVAKVPDDVNASCAYTEERVTANIGLLQSGEEFTIRVLCDGNPELPGPTCRIDGITQIEVVKSMTPPNPASGDHVCATAK
jgi:hypothetical protein